MKISVEMGNELQEEIIIRCSQMTPEILRLQQLLADTINHKSQLVLSKNNTDFYVDTASILFFETQGSIVLAHTTNDVFETHQKLYELEEILGRSFMRISKSSIVNIGKIYSIRRNVTASSEIEFFNSHKVIYVSRAYYKALKDRLEEKR